MPKILLVEYNHMNRDMLSRRLRRQGFGEAGCADYDNKPVELSRLLGKISELLG